MWLNSTGDRMNIEWLRTTRPRTGGSAGPPVRIEHEISANVGERVDEDAEQPAASAYRRRRHLIVANIVAWILIVLAIRAFFF
jgi:hypothetical protein